MKLGFKMVLPLLANKSSKKDSPQSSSNPSSSVKKIISDDVKSTLDQIPHHILMIYDDIFYANSSLRNFIQLNKTIYSLQDIVNAFHPEDTELFLNIWETAQKTGQPIHRELRLKNEVSNQYEWFLVLSKGFTEDEPLTCSLTFTNIQQHVLEMQLFDQLSKVHTEILDASIDCIKIVNPNGYIRHMNKSGCKALLGQDKISPSKLKWLDLLPAEERDKGQIAINKANQGEIARFSGASGLGQSRQYWDNILTPINNTNGTVSNILCISRNVTEQKKPKTYCVFLMNMMS